MEKSVTLQHKLEMPVRFNEADPLGIVWHGHYVRYFEDGREGFGKQFGLSYMDFYKCGLVVPIVSIQCNFKKPLRYGDTMMICTTFIPTLAAKIQFRYEIYESSEGQLVASGSSTQVLVDRNSFELHLTNPPFFDDWKSKWKVA